MTTGILLQIADILSGHHAGVHSEMEECIRDTARYYKEHRQQYEERGIGAASNEQEERSRQWVALADCLISSSIAAELDRKCGLEDFLYAAGGLEGVKKNELPLKEDWFDKEDSIEEWCRILNKKWEALNFCLAQMDIDSDSYVIFPVSILALAPLNEAAKLIERKIEKACGGMDEEENRTHEFFVKQGRELETEGYDDTSDRCELCASQGKEPGQRPCERNQFQCFQINVKPQELGENQLHVIGRCFRLNPSVVKKRIAGGKAVYVKNILKETLEAMKELEEADVKYDVIPFAPNYASFSFCRERNPGGASDLFEERFDREREEDFRIK